MNKVDKFKDLDCFYSVSEGGQIKSLRSGKILKTRTDSKGKGYAYVNLNYNGKKVTRQVHRLVAQVFLPNPNNLPCVNHKDENPANNNVSNLEWCSYSYNLSYGSKTRKELKTKQIIGTINSPKIVAQITPSGNTVIAVYNSIADAARSTGINKTTISKCCNNVMRVDKRGIKHSYRTAGGFIWEFLDRTPENSEKA